MWDLDSLYAEIYCVAGEDLAVLGLYSTVSMQYVGFRLYLGSPGLLALAILIDRFRQGLNRDGV